MRLSATLSIILLGFLSFVSSLPTGTPGAHALNKRDPQKFIPRVGSSLLTLPPTSRGNDDPRKVLILHVREVTMHLTRAVEVYILYLPLYTRGGSKFVNFWSIGIPDLPWENDPGASYTHFNPAHLVIALLSAVQQSGDRDDRQLSKESFNMLKDYIQDDKNRKDFKITGMDRTILEQNETNMLLNFIGNLPPPALSRPIHPLPHRPTPSPSFPPTLDPHFSGREFPIEGSPTSGSLLPSSLRTPCQLLTVGRPRGLYLEETGTHSFDRG